MVYTITTHSKKQAEKLGVDIKPSKLKNKKIDVFKGGKKVASIGDSRYNDYGVYLKTKGKKFADNRRRLYKDRHNKDRKVVNTPGYYADKILW